MQIRLVGDLQDCVKFTRNSRLRYSREQIAENGCTREKTLNYGIISHKNLHFIIEIQLPGISYELYEKLT